MANTPTSTNRFAGGISDYIKESPIQSAYYFGQSVDYRNDPNVITLLPASLKESGSVVVDLLKWGDITPSSLTTYFYGNAGNIYSRTTTPSWTNLHKAPSSHGNGLAYFAGDDYLYYTTDASLGRYGPISSSPQFADNFLQAQGGVPQNTASISLVAASTMYGHAADSASLSVTGNLTLETYFKANTLPAVGSSMTLVGKWDESGTTMSYKMDLFGVSGYFGTGGDGALTISSDTTEAPIDSSCTGTAGIQSLAATNVSFAIGQVIFIHQTQGTNAGQWERNTIQGYTAGTITLGTPLLGTYATGAQVRVLKQYTNATINSGKTYTAKAWNGTVGGILAFLANGTLTVTGSISASQCGFRGARQNHTAGVSEQGEGYPGLGNILQTSNGNGGGGDGDFNAGAGGGGGNGTSGGNGEATGGTGGSAVGATDLTSMFLGGGGGMAYDNTSFAGVPGSGGGILFLTSATITVSGSIVSNGGNGGLSGTYNIGSGGSAGGSILLKAQTATLGTGIVTAAGGTGGIGSRVGGNGGVGRIALNYLTSYTGTTTPTLNATQDNTLVTTTTIQARLGISSNGSTAEYLTQNLNTLTTGTWNRLSIPWTASTSTASFYLNAVLLGTSVGTKTAIHDNASLLTVGANNSGSGIANYFDGLLNDMRVWSNAQTGSQIFANNNIQVSATSAGLVAYYKFNSAATDATGNGNNLTLVNTPTYSTDVPFAAPTTRLDIDTQNTSTGQLYTLLTSISEASTDTLSFTPVNDPQASVGFYVDTKGTGDWTVTVHDQQNRVIASKTILAASVPSSGFCEFIFSTPWRIIIGKTYHMHLTVSTGTSKVVSGTISDFSTAEYATYFSFLVTDTQFHPAISFLNFIAIGNERYVAKWDGAFYTPNLIALPPQWRVRCFGTWREFLAIGVWRGGNIYDYDKGRIYFWDGISLTFNFFIDVPEGQINALFGVDSDLYMFAGWRGQLLSYQGGYFYNTGNSKSNKLRFIPRRASTDYFEVYPGALTMWRSLLHFGVASSSNSTAASRGVYSYGTLNPKYDETLSFDYPISTGNTGNTVMIGLTYPVGQNLIVGWQDGISYGADAVNFNNAPAASGEIQLLIRDEGAVWKQKGNFDLRADFLPLKTGEGIDVEYKLDRTTSFTVSTKDTTLLDTFTKLPIGTGRGREFQIGAHLYATGTTSPTLIGLSLLELPNTEEQVF